jgi:uncharacterized protein (DUF1800 family)
MNAKTLGCLLAVTLAAGPVGAIGFDDARHLLNRTGFGATVDDVAQFSKLSWDQAVDQILDGTSTTPHTDLPYWADGPVGGILSLRLLALQGMSGADVQLEREAIGRRQEGQTRNRGSEIRAWWWNEMVQTDSPLTERMVLFWHNHFTSEIGVVQSPELMLQQNRMFRLHALGNFKELVMEATKDAAMIIYLDNNSNVKGNPNENFARELMELFTLGEGHVYTEEDIREASRAFTGWRVDMMKKVFVFEERLHDFEEKKFLGKTGDFNGDDIVRIILENPRVAEFITEKLWVCLVSDKPDPEEVKRIADVFREGNYEIKPLVREILLSDHFRSPRNRGNLIKSPVDLIVGSARLFGAHPAQAQQISQFGAQLGQDLFQPPDVAGWKGGTYWIDANTLITRHNLSRLILARPDKQMIERYEADLKRRKLAHAQADRERREIDRLLKSQKSMLDSMMGDEEEMAGMEEEITMAAAPDEVALEMQIDDALDKTISVEDQVNAQLANMDAMDIREWIMESGLSGKDSTPLARLLLPLPPVHGDTDAMEPQEMVHSLLLDPAFQLK